MPQFVERSACPVCGEAPDRTVYRCSYRDDPVRSYLFSFYAGFGDADLALLGDAEYVLETCGRCGTVWQRFAPDGALLSTLYERWAAAGSELGHHDNAAYHRAAAEEVLLVLELVRRAPSAIRVLDFGMGWGRWPRLAAAFGMQAHGVELSRAQSAYAATQGVRVLTLDELPDASFDFVNSEQVFEHLVDPHETIVRLGRAVTPGGWLKIAVPDASGIASRLAEPDFRDRSLNAVAPLEHLNAYPGDALDELGRQAGLVPARPPLSAFYASTIGLWPAKRAARGLGRPVIRRVSPGARFFRRSA